VIYEIIGEIIEEGRLLSPSGIQPALNGGCFLVGAGVIFFLFWLLFWSTPDPIL